MSVVREPSAIDKLAALYPKCRACGKDWVADSEAEAERLLAQNEWYTSTCANGTNPERNLIANIVGREVGWICEKCSFLSATERANAERTWKRERLLESTYRYGKIPRAGMFHNFSQSTQQAEAQNPDAWKTARSWRNDSSLWIAGTPGTGKTFMARCLMNWALDHCISVLEVNAVYFVEWVYRQGEKQIHEAHHIGLLAIDDLDKPEWRVDSLVALWWLMDIRQRDRLHTVLTANVTPELMRSRWKAAEGDRAIVGPILDRMGAFKRIELQGKSLRHAAQTHE